MTTFEKMSFCKLVNCVCVEIWKLLIADLAISCQYRGIAVFGKLTQWF